MLGRDQRALIIPDAQGVKRIIALQSFEIIFSSRAEVGGACSTRTVRFFYILELQSPPACSTRGRLIIEELRYVHTVTCCGLILSFQSVANVSTIVFFCT